MRILSLFFIVWLLCSCGSEKTDSQTEIRHVKFAKIEQLTGKESHTFSGLVIARNEVALSFKVSGTLSKLNVALGDKVKKGHLIATVDPTDFQIQSNQSLAQKEGAVANQQSAESNVKAAETTLIHSQATYERIAQLYENNSVSLSEYQQAKANLDASKAQHESAKSQLNAAITQVTTADQQVQTANNQLSYTRINSPTQGVITGIGADENELVSAGYMIAMLSSVDQMLVEVGVPEVFISRLSKGQKAIIKLPSLQGQEFLAEIIEVAFASGSASTFPVKLKIIDPVEAIRPGMATEVAFEIENSQKGVANLPMAPIKAIVGGVEGNYVFRLIPDKAEGTYRAEKVAVSLGDITRNAYLIKEGLQTGDLVAVAGLNSLYDGRIVKLLEN